MKKSKRIHIRIEEALFTRLKRIQNFSEYVRNLIKASIGGINHAE